MFRVFKEKRIVKPWSWWVKFENSSFFREGKAWSENNAFLEVDKALEEFLKENK